VKDFVNEYQKHLPEKFNKNFIMLRQEDDILDYINSICKALEVIDGIEYVGGEIITDESKFKNPGKSKIHKNTELPVKKYENEEDIPQKRKSKLETLQEITEWIGIKESRLNLIKMRFKLRDDEGNFNLLEKDIYVPKIINNFYFILNGSKYFPILQIVDKSTYNNIRGQYVVLKTLLMPIILKYVHNIEIKTNKDEVFVGKRFLLYLFKHKINIINYYFARYGYTKTMKILNIKKSKIRIISNSKIDKFSEKYHIFQINNNISIAYNKKIAKTSNKKVYYTNLICTMFEVFNNRSTMKTLDNIEYWKKKFGQYFTKNTNNQLQKAEKILISFNRIFDANTKRYLKVEKKYKRNIYYVIRWMMENYENLLSKDNFSLDNKRIRLYEYLLYPLLVKFSNSTYRILNSKSVSAASLKSIFSTLSPGFIIKKLLTHELLRYSGDSNAIDLFNSALRFTYKGPQSMSSGGNSTMSVKYRSIHPSYIGRISLTASSASDPGCTGTITPLIDCKGLFFSEENE